ncbi:hypothetical protein CONPUDRAFT_98379 [Coniophora puteana RWD-64-598 SS2]|uniref:NAD(P)-binding protein n=1 Tax=Coniophora puteana (strain RWD-64-598) TaxID=741705 RepID=A0A5M3N1W3_CONPW|nr:uncharacterized protein CONPUDRAFT_98379 [Coniophora puteana RWD-64-598 SS2]EIW85380.1 hypothetical protein CONPUDRAFT_98379 [Coniophora puteana RWD-64-598 SS2]
MADKPSAIIFGGVNTCSRALVALLVPLGGDPLVSHLRIVDKFSVFPPTTYIGAEFAKILNQGGPVEYRQANLTVPAAVAQAFEPPQGVAPYSLVFDLTGEINYDRGEPIFIQTTFTVARHIALEATKRNVAAYVRLQLPVYESPEKGDHSEAEDVKPVTPRDTWWHETTRMLAGMPELNLVILRIGFVYGPYVDYGLMAQVITVASVYGYMSKPMKTLWGPGKDPINTIHVDDVAGGLWACANWIKGVGRKQADIEAGVPVLFHNDKAKVAEVEGTVSPKENPIAPVFNLVDESETTLVSAGNTITSFFGTTFEFYNTLQNTVARFRLDDVVDEINEHHVGTWTQMQQMSQKPITHSPLNGYMDRYALSRHRLAYDASKIKAVVGYKLKRPTFCRENIREMIDKWKEDGVWPILD